MLQAADYLVAMRRLVPINVDANLEVWTGDRWDDALHALAEEHGLKGPVQRLLAALDSVAAS
jgi:hypothetical protein